jgi:hypothetical protein
VNVEGTATASRSLPRTIHSDSLPPYNRGTTGQSSTHAHQAESEHDGFGTIVTEVTTVTTRRRYRVEDA